MKWMLAGSSVMLFLALAGGVVMFMALLWALRLFVGEQEVRHEDLVWADVVLLLYRGPIEDPATWNTSDANAHLSQEWQIFERHELFTMLNRYTSLGDFPAFDTARAIYLARVGVGASLITEEEGLTWVSKAVAKSKSDFASWDDFFRDLKAGLIDWYEGTDDRRIARLDRNLKRAQKSGTMKKCSYL